MAKRLISIFLCILLLFTAAAVLTACGGDELEEHNAGVLIYGKRANALDCLSSFMEKYADMLESCVSKEKVGGDYIANSNLYVVISDGSPRIEQLQYPKITAKNKKSRDNQVDNYFSNFENWIGNIMPDDPEADLIAAINVASNTLHGLRGDFDHLYLFICDNGFTTSGFLDLTLIDNLQNRNVSEIVEGIPSESLPDLSGVEVFFDGIGSICAPQTDNHDKKIQDLIFQTWEKLIQDKMGCLTLNGGMGLGYNPLDGAPLEYYEGGGLPFVSVIPFTTESPKPRKLSVEFVFDKPDFLSPEKAVRYIKTLANDYQEVLDADKDTKLYIVASIAPTFNENTGKFTYYETDGISKGRAQNVLNIFVNRCGIPRSRIVAIDAGTTELSWRCAKDKTGNVITEDSILPDWKKASTNEERVEIKKRLEAIRGPHRIVYMFTDKNDECVAEIKKAGLLTKQHIIP